MIEYMNTQKHLLWHA